tara:strand:- start:45827 stop:46012 length:186 start_codon:yes stop_codon:yes gene_type:complete
LDRINLILSGAMGLDASKSIHPGIHPGNQLANRLAKLLLGMHPSRNLSKRHRKMMDQPSVR